MKNIRLKLSSFSAALVLFIFGSYVQFLSPNAIADDIINRRVFIQSSFASEITVHDYRFDTVTAGNVGSIEFLYCSNSPLINDPCTAPVGLNVAPAGVLSESGMTGFVVSGVSTANSLVISRAPLAEVPVTATYSFDNITNPSTPNEVVYVRIRVMDNINNTGSIIDSGSVVFVTEDPFDISAYVPPYMTFCVGVTVALDCSSTAGFLANFGEFSRFSPSTASSQFSVATNDPSGYNTFINGQTMTSGANIIPGLPTQTPSQPGQSQFGINLRANSSPSVGSNPEAGPVASGSPAPNYNIPNRFRFVNGDRLAGASLSTGFNKYTVSYLVNVSENQRPGVYAATLTYTSIASF